MKLTAFHLANKVEEAARSYFSGSFVFSGRTINVERCMDFRKGSASLQFFLKDGDEQVPMGGMEFTSIQERDHKMALQCRYNIQPTDYTEQFFMILRTDIEQYSKYIGLSEYLQKQWDRNTDAYLPKNEEIPQMVREEPKSVDDEYASLTPEEIEAITGVRPDAPGASEEPAASGAGDADDIASEDEIQKLMGMMMGGGAPKAEEKDPQSMSMEEIEALARDVQSQAEEPEDAGEKPEGTEAKDNEPEDTGPVENVSVEDIWKQISGGGKS